MKRFLFRGLFRSVTVLGVLSLLTVFAFGQAETGTISGTVKDAQGAVVPNANVTVASLNTGAERKAVTSGGGEFTITNLQPGPYQVSIEASGFAKFISKVNVAVGSHNTIDAAMQLGTTSTTVEVTAGAVEVDTTTQQLSQVVTAQQVSQLPSLTRNPYDLVSLAGNASEDPAGRGANGIALNGQRSASTDILLDGAENVNLFTASVGQQVPLDSVQEFRVTSSGFTADLGRASGGVVNVATKAGTNGFHGSAYEFNRVAKLTSNTYDNNANGVPRSPYTRNQFGYSFGGPVKKDKLFFFTSTEWLRVRSNQLQLAYVLDPAFLAVSNANTQSYFAALGALKPGTKQVGAPLTVNDLNNGLGIATGPAFTLLPPTTPVLDLVQYSFPNDVGGGGPQNTWNTTGRVDYNFSSKTQFFARYSGWHAQFQQGWISNNAYAGFDTGENDFNQNVLLNLTRIVSPTLVSTTKASYNRLNQLQPLGSAGVVPNLYYNLGGQLTINGHTTMLPGYLPTSTGNAIPFGGPQNVTQLIQDLSWSRGNHQFKFGGSYIYTRDNRVFGAYEEGNEFLARASTSSAFDGLVNGNLYRFSVGIFPQNEFPCLRDPVSNAPIVTPSCTLTGPVTSPNFSRSNRYNDGNWYVQDNWKAMPRLTLNLGVRWEYYGIQHDKHAANDANFVLGPGSNIFQQINSGFVANGNNLPGGKLWNSSKKNFAPRVGFAYDLSGNGKTSLRGGYGIAYERNFGNVTFNIIQNPPNYAVVQVQNARDVPAGTLAISPNNFGFLGGPGQIPFRSPTLRAVDRNIKTAYVHLWNLSLEHEVARSTVAAVEYSGSRGLKGYSISPYNDFGYGPAYLGLGCAGPGGGLGGLNCLANGNPSQRLNLQYNSINYRTNGSDSYHHALNLKLNSSNLFNQGLAVTANYTWSHTIDDLSATFGGSDELAANTLGFLDPFKPALDKGDADYDVRHRISLGADWTLPYAKNTHGVLKQILDGWELAPVVNARTGYPYTIYDCTNAFGFNCPRFIPGGPVSATGHTGTSGSSVLAPNVFAYENLPVALVYGSPYGDGNSTLPTCALDPVTQLSTGNNCNFPASMTRRNSFRQPGFWNTNFGIYKNFKVTERITMQFRGELYNLFNHSNYYVQTGNLNNVSGLVADVGATVVPSTCVSITTPCFNGAAGDGSNNGQPEYTNGNGQGIGYTIQGKKGSPQGASTTPSLIDRRFIQFALKLNF